jgi:integrase/recombinase XerD
MSNWDELIAMWLHGMPASTQSVYRPVIQHFRLTVGRKPIGRIGLKELQQYADQFVHQKPRTIARKICTVKSLWEFAEKTGVIRFNPARALRTPKIPSDLAEKILPADMIRKMIRMEPKSRNKVLLTILYAAGIRASEAVGLRWMDCVRRKGKGGQITVLGKGSKTRSIVLSPKTWNTLLSIKPKDAKPKDPVFVSREGENKPLDRTHVSRIVREAAERAGIEAHVSAHWLRHGHATHAMDNGVSLPLIAQTMGHESLETTARYLHVNPDASSAAYFNI